MLCFKSLCWSSRHLVSFSMIVQEKCALYWPEEGKPTLYGDYLVSMEGETVDGDVTLRDFLVTCTKVGDLMRCHANTFFLILEVVQCIYVYLLARHSS